VHLSTHVWVGKIYLSLKPVFHVLKRQSLPNITKDNYLNPCSFWKPSHTNSRGELKKEKKEKKKGNKSRYRLWDNMKKRMRMVKTERGRDRKSENGIERWRGGGSFGVQWAVRQVHSLWSKHCVPLRISALTQAANTVATDTKLTSQLHYSAGGVYRPATPKGSRRPAKNINCF